MGYAEKRGDYWRGRYKIAPGRYGTVADETGAGIKFSKKKDAEQAADLEEAKVKAGTWQDPASGRTSFQEYVSAWFSGQDLALSSMESYKQCIEVHLLPQFGEMPLSSIQKSHVDSWEKELRTGYAATSVRTWRAILHLILADAVEEGFITANPAARRRGRGKRAGRAKTRGPEKTVVDPLRGLLIAERASLLSGRDDEFVQCVLMHYTGLRWGETVGLETKFVRPLSVRVEWQLYELDTGEFVRCPPKDDSYRTLDMPPWLTRLVTQHIARVGPQPCQCHGLRYVFRGQPTSGGRPGAKVVDVARRAGVSTGTVSNALNRPDRVADDTLVRVTEAMDELDFVRQWKPDDFAAHLRRNGFATWVHQPAATGWYPRKAPHNARPVPLLPSPWPGVPVRGRGAPGRAEVCWVALAERFTPHGWRHTKRTMMEALGTPKVLMDDRMGHEDGSVSALYSHITQGMRAALMADLTTVWEEALDARRDMHPRSPVKVLDDLLQARC